MKRFLVCLTLLLAVVAVSSAQIIEPLRRPSDKELRKAAKTLMYKTNGHDLTAKRLKAMDVVQAEINCYQPSEWKSYRAMTSPSQMAEVETSGVPYLLRQAIAKVQTEVASTSVKDGKVAVWLLYNMGYIVKTPTTVFGIDIHSKYVGELVNMLDFVLVTHSHSDHCNKEFLKAMSAAGKQVFAAFDIEGVNVTKVVHEGEYNVGDIMFRTTQGDHNKKLLKFVTAYEIDCGRRSGNTVIYHTGDSNNYKQLTPQKQVDIFIPHMSVGLNMYWALRNIRPHHVFLSHIQELAHRVDRWRWTFHDALALKAKLKHEHIWIPCWGERVVYCRSDWEL